MPGTCAQQWRAGAPADSHSVNNCWGQEAGCAWGRGTRAQPLAERAAAAAPCRTASAGARGSGRPGVVGSGCYIVGQGGGPEQAHARLPGFRRRPVVRGKTAAAGRGCPWWQPAAAWSCSLGAVGPYCGGGIAAGCCGMAGCCGAPIICGTAGMTTCGTRQSSSCIDVRSSSTSAGGRQGRGRRLQAGWQAGAGLAAAGRQAAVQRWGAPLCDCCRHVRGGAARTLPPRTHFGSRRRPGSCPRRSPSPATRHTCGGPARELLVGRGRAARRQCMCCSRAPHMHKRCLT